MVLSIVVLILMSIQTDFCRGKKAVGQWSYRMSGKCKVLL